MVQSPTESPRIGRGWLVVSAILLLAAGVRLAGTADRPVWTDEGFMAWISSDLDVATVTERAEAWDRHAPLYVFVVGGWRELAGDSRLALRFWAIMSGVVATALVYRIGVDWQGPVLGRTAALLFAVLAIAVYYGQEIRGYGWLIMAVCWLAFFFLRYLRQPRLIWLVGFALSVALTLYTVYSGALIIALMGLITLMWRGTWRHKFALLIAVIVGVALFTPWLVVVIREYERVQTGIKGAPGTYGTTGSNILTLSKFVWGDQLALMAGVWLLGAGMILKNTIRGRLKSPHPSANATCGRASGSLSLRAREKDGPRAGFSLLPEGEGAGMRAQKQLLEWPLNTHKQNQGWLTGLFLLLAGGGMFAFMLLVNLSVPVVAARTLVFVTPFVMLVCAGGLMRIASPVREIFVVLVVGLALTSVPTIQPRIAYDDTARALAADFARGDLVILETGWDDNAFMYEISLAVPDGATIIRTLPWVDPGHIEPVLPHLEAVIGDYDRVWVVQWLQESKAIPWLDAGTDGFARVRRHEVSIGDEYLDRYLFYPPLVQIVLFERTDQPEPPRLFGDVMALHTAITGAQVAPGERLQVDLWWSAVETMTRDYSVGVYLMPLDEDRVIAQHDGPPGDLPTSAWVVDERHFDRHTLRVPDDLAAGTYRVTVRAYWFEDGVPLPVEGGDLALAGLVDVKK